MELRDEWRYKVLSIETGSESCLLVGDVIHICDKGNLFIQRGRTSYWVCHTLVDENLEGVCLEVDKEFIERRVKELQEEIKELEEHL
jgi:hypothetical protein